MSSAEPVGPNATGLRVRGLRVEAGAATVVAGLELDLPSGAFLAVTGHAASGKSTLLAALAGSRPPAAGTVTLDGTDVGPDDLGTRIGYAPQVVQVIETLTAIENVALPLVVEGVEAAEAWQRAEAELAAVDLAAGDRHNLAEQLSGGERQRVNVARATVGRRGLVVLDDPTSELDPVTAGRVGELIGVLAGTGAVVVVATSDAALLAAADETITLAASSTAPTAHVLD